jgi:hypothetical protein
VPWRLELLAFEPIFEVHKFLTTVIISQIVENFQLSIDGLRSAISGVLSHFLEFVYLDKPDIDLVALYSIGAGS